MNDMENVFARIPDTKILIMLAVWHITNNDQTKSATRDEIALFILQKYSKKLTSETIRKSIRNIQTGFGNPFKKIGQRIHINGDLQDTYRINDETTVAYPITAYALLDLATHGMQHQNPVSQKAATIMRCAKELGYPEKIVKERLEKVISGEYAIEIDGELGEREFRFTEKFELQRPYIEELAFIAKQGDRLQNNNQPVSVNRASKSEGD